MQILKFQTVKELNVAGAGFITSHIKGNDGTLLCAATGSSSTGIYKELVEQRAEIDTRSLSFIMLDEWAGLAADHPGSCEYYLQQHLLRPLNIPDSNYTSFNSKANDPAAECSRMAKELNTKGPIDLCILGIGLNGHIAFNEPAEELQPGIHLAKLSETSLAHPMVKDVADKLQYGYTLGIGDILRSKTILLVVHGAHKRAILEQLLKAKVSTQLPASFLWLHADAHCYYCED